MFGQYYVCFTVGVILLVYANANDHNPIQTTQLDNFKEMFIYLRRFMFNLTFEHINDLYMQNKRDGKVQQIIPDSFPFFCDIKNAKSGVVPSSVHKVRPGDIDVISSIGDSLSAGNGGISENIVHILNEFRGLSFSGGGRATWRKYLTLPNILKEFNPRLYGYSVADGLTVDKVSRLNIAEPMVMSRDMTYQAKVLITRMKSDPNVKMKTHWKLLTIFVGNNDICSDMCHYKQHEKFIKNHEQDLKATLKILRNNVPRLIVNIVPAPNMAALYNMKKVPQSCHIIHHIGCHCMFSSKVYGHKLQMYLNLITKWQQVEEMVTNLQEFQTNDFAVLFQPFMANISTPKTVSGNTDLRYFASDCFHFSQRGHAATANALWNNMMQQQGQKQLDMYSEFKYFECPTKERPFIATKGNSFKRKA